jgi:gamma-glutamyl hercynylcysteine S-oxide hydrolase
VCRHLAYLGPPRRLGELLADPPHSLVRQSWAPRRQTHGVVNADGFGVGWYPNWHPAGPDPAGEPAGPARHRGGGPVWADETFAELCRVISSHAVLAAVRSATMAAAAGAAAAAPFRDGRWLFSHNGALDGWPTAARPLLRRLPEAAALALEAPTDTALLWALVRQLLHAGAAPAAALAEVVQLAADCCGGRLNLLLTDGASITATCAGASLCWRELTDGGLVVASEPYDDEPGWHDVPDGHLLHVAAGEVSLAALAAA